MSTDSMAGPSDLLDFVSSLSNGDGMRVEERLGDGYVRLRVSEAERRQAKHDIRCVEDAVIELLRNSRDAGATSVYLATSREGDIRKITVIDNGSGVPKHMQARIFDARVTSKLDSMIMDRWGVHGRGMALFSIRENAESAQVLLSGIGLGCALQVCFDVRSVKERADQSTWPLVGTGDSETPIVRGPKNILRACVEFALESQKKCNVYVGLPSEVVATMRCNAQRDSSQRCMARTEADLEFPVWKRPSLAMDARQLAQVAAELGMSMSDRNAHRIIKGEIHPLPNVLTHVMPKDVRLRQDAMPQVPRRNLPLTEEERSIIANASVAAFSGIAERYYVLPSGNPTIRCSDGRLIISIPYIEDE